MRQRTFFKSPAPAIIAMSLLHLGFLDQPFRSEHCLSIISNHVSCQILIFINNISGLVTIRKAVILVPPYLNSSKLTKCKSWGLSMLLSREIGDNYIIFKVSLGSDIISGDNDDAHQVCNQVVMVGSHHSN